MKTTNFTISLLGFALLLGSSFTAAQTVAGTLLNIQHEWASCQYNLVEKDLKISCLEKVIIANENALKITPASSKLKIWLAINNSSLAGAKGGLGALSLVKKSKQLLEEVIAVNPAVLEGSAYTSLGSLYYQVPGWPIGFGNDKKAEVMLKKALAINPNGIDPNYFYADFLAQNGRKKEAIAHFKKALLASLRPARPLADKGRLQEIANKLKELEN
ncbi:protein containing tetratricopeptide (TPR) repeat [Psychromonas ingrahamii 37]|uniref:Protein containing tetratricopeptide (TPR) repeat n=1 Tax=Psychromonas ingrahamii (strain DSM 17664 / CCUG 51855 / 37) TaxID=357804 RepID=A1STH6_PSYIN|nr:tetratricopeptide repeat protein [Psychromonas ingrahamii]ABM02791.1 protein containing tetratricopeptide (TPR) repeat [Psychromonas ingrahamii 37]